MNGFGTILDNAAIIAATEGATREQALKVRESLRNLLRAIEDINQLPFSVQTKAERDAELSQMIRVYLQDHGHDPTINTHR